MTHSIPILGPPWTWGKSLQVQTWGWWEGSSAQVPFPREEGCPMYLVEGLTHVQKSTIGPLSPSLLRGSHIPSRRANPGNVRALRTPPFPLVTSSPWQAHWGSKPCRLVDQAILSGGAAPSCGLQEKRVYFPAPSPATTPLPTPAPFYALIEQEFIECR